MEVSKEKVEKFYFKKTRKAEEAFHKFSQEIMYSRFRDKKDVVTQVLMYSVETED